jgi:hypothetical protein
MRSLVLTETIVEENMEQLRAILDQLVKEFASDPNILSVSIIGSAASRLDRLEQVRDIDLFVVKETSDGFEREVKLIGDKEFDISYIDVDDLNKIIIKDNHFWLNILSKAKHVYKKNSLIEGYFQLANRLYLNGPNLLTEKEILYLRFKMTKQVEDLEARVEKPFHFQYLANIYLPEILSGFFKLQNTWVPRDKKILDLLFNTDIVLYELIKACYTVKEVHEHLRLIDDVVIYILKPYGGKISLLERCHLPIYE